VREAAAAWGARGESNHVYVGFAFQAAVERKLGPGATGAAQAGVDTKTASDTLTPYFRSI
jgi:hypothetical protein